MRFYFHLQFGGSLRPLRNESNMQIVFLIQGAAVFACSLGMMTHVCVRISALQYLHNSIESKKVSGFSIDPLLILVAVDEGPDDDPDHDGRHGEGNEFLRGATPSARCNTWREIGSLKTLTPGPVLIARAVWGAATFVLFISFSDLSESDFGPSWAVSSLSVEVLSP